VRILHERRGEAIPGEKTGKTFHGQKMVRRTFAAKVCGKVPGGRREDQRGNCFLTGKGAGALFADTGHSIAGIMEK